MAGSVPTIFWFDRFDDRIGILPVVGGLVHTEELNGEDTIENVVNQGLFYLDWLLVHQADFKLLVMGRLGKAEAEKIAGVHQPFAGPKEGYFQHFARSGIFASTELRPKHEFHNAPGGACHVVENPTHLLRPLCYGQHGL